MLLYSNHVIIYAILLLLYYVPLYMLFGFYYILFYILLGYYYIKSYYIIRLLLYIIIYVI